MEKHFYYKPKLSRGEAKQIEMLEILGIFSIILKPGKIHVLENLLSRITNDESMVNNVEVLYVDFSKL